MIRDRNRYSRWAIAAGAAATTAIANFFTIFLFGNSRANSVYLPNFAGYHLVFAHYGFVFGIIACGPATIVLAKIAIWDINKRPYLRGRLLAELVTIVGWLSVAIEVALAFLAVALHLSGALDGA